MTQMIGQPLVGSQRLSVGKKKTAMAPYEGARRTEEGQRQVRSTHHRKELTACLLEGLS